MAIKQLTEEQIRTWTLPQKDKWWFENVWRGDMPQLTLRSALSGMLIGGLLSMTNLYVGAKTGWTLGVGITSVIVAFAMFKVMSQIGLAREFTILENNCMQSIATAAGYMTSPMISSLAAYMLVTGVVLPQGATMIWIVAIALLGVLFAFPLKRRFINDEQHPFPEGRAAGIVMDALHTGNAADGLLKAKILVVAGSLSALAKLFSSHPILEKVRLGFLTLPEFLDGWIYKIGTLRLFGTDLRELTVRADTDFVMMGAGGLMGIRTGVSLLVGAVLNYVLLAPLMIQAGEIEGRAGADGLVHFGFRSITTWSLWCGVSMMTVASLYAFFAKPQILVSAFTGMFRRNRAGQEEDILKSIELPMSVFVVGIPGDRGGGGLAGACAVRRGHLAGGDRDSIDLYLHAHRGELDRLDFHHSDRGVGQTDAADLRSSGPGQYQNQPGHGVDHGGSRGERGEPADGHQAGLHAGRQAAAAGGGSRAGHLCRRAGFRPHILRGVPEPRTGEPDHGPIPDAGCGDLANGGGAPDPGPEQLEGVRPMGGVGWGGDRPGAGDAPGGHQRPVLVVRGWHWFGLCDSVPHLFRHVPGGFSVLAGRRQVA